MAKITYSEYDCKHGKTMLKEGYTEKMKRCYDFTDEQSVKQGHWEEINEYCGWGDTHYRCSVCGNEWGLDAGKWNGCPICLARMDGDTECHDTK